MQIVKEREVGMMFWSDRDRLDEIKSMGVRCGQLGIPGSADLGNHSYSHLNINKVSLDGFTADITRGEPIVKAALAARGRTLKYFRHPFLFTGPTSEVKLGLQQFLDFGLAVDLCLQRI